MASRIHCGSMREMVSTGPKLTHADGKYIDYSFDELDRAYRIRLNGTTQLWNQFHSNGKCQYVHRNWRKDGATTKYGFDPAQRLTSLNQNFKSTVNGVTYVYTYNPAQQITELTISNPTFHDVGNDNITGSYTANGLNLYIQIDGKSVSYENSVNLTSYNGMRGGFSIHASPTGVSAP